MASKSSRRILLVLLGLGVVVALVVLGGWFAAPSDLRSILGFVAWRPLHSPDARDLEVGEVTLHTEIYGEGDPVLVLHGGFGMIEIMGNQIRALAPHYQVVALDTRAHGRSTDGDGPLTYDLLAEDASGLIRALGIQRVHVVGWSDGANTALLLAIHHPDQVASVVAISGNASPEAVRPEAEAELGPIALENPLIQQAKQVYDLLSPTPEHFPVFLAKMDQMIHNEPHITAEQLGNIRAPTPIVGAEDDIVAESHFRWMVSAIPGAEVRITRGTRHEQPLTDPEQVDAAMLAWLDAHPMP